MPKRLHLLNMQYPSQHIQAPAQVADSGKGLGALMSFLLPSPLIFPDKRVQVSAKQVLSHQSWRRQQQPNESPPALGAGCRALIQPSYPPKTFATCCYYKHRGQRCYKGFLFSHRGTESRFLHLQLRQRCYRWQSLKESSWHLLEQSTLSKVH